MKIVLVLGKRFAQQPAVLNDNAHVPPAEVEIASAAEKLASELSLLNYGYRLSPDGGYGYDCLVGSPEQRDL